MLKFNEFPMGHTGVEKLRHPAQHLMEIAAFCGVAVGRLHHADCSAGIDYQYVFLHLFAHLQKNDNNILALLSSQNNELFLRYFREGLAQLIENQLQTFEPQRKPNIPDSFWKNHIVSAFIETLKWWLDNGMQESPETITGYFLQIV